MKIYYIAEATMPSVSAYSRHVIKISLISKKKFQVNYNQPNKNLLHKVNTYLNFMILIF